MREVGRLLPISEYVFPAAKTLLAKTEPASERDEFESRVLATQALWEGVRTRSDNRKDVLERVFPLAQNYDESYNALNVWLKQTEQKVLNLAPVPCDAESLTHQQTNLKASFLLSVNCSLVVLLVRLLVAISRCSLVSIRSHTIKAIRGSSI